MRRLLLLMTVAMLAGPARAQVDCREGSPDYPACLFKKSVPKPSGSVELSPPSRPTIPTTNMDMIRQEMIRQRLDTKNLEIKNGRIIVN